MYFGGKALLTEIRQAGTAARCAAALALVLFCTSLGIGQTQNNASPMREALQSSLAAMLGNATANDVTLSGSADVTFGPKHESGAFLFKATAIGASQIELTGISEPRTETRTPGPQSMEGVWSKGDGVQHPIAAHNLMTGSDWLLPALTLTRILQNSAMAVGYGGQDDGLLHFWAYEMPPGASTAILASLQHLTRTDLWLDPKTLLPARLSFNTHPDNNADVDIPVRVDYSNYQSRGGVTTPSHVQEYFNGTLLLDLQIQSVSLNSGLTAGDFSIQN